jgi:ParB/RepB/Spo0J family partition protein
VTGERKETDVTSFRCTYCESLIPWRLTERDVGIPDGDEFRPGATYPYTGCPCGYGRFARYEGEPGTQAAPDSPPGILAAKVEQARYDALPVAAVHPNPRQPRRFFDAKALTGLATSIRSVGLLEDILVRPVGAEYEIVLGERRWRATQLAGRETIRAKIVDLSDDEVRDISITENIHREDLTPVEEAFSFKAYVDDGDGISDVGRRFGGMQDRVAERLKLLNSHSYITYQQQRIDELLVTVERLRELRNGAQLKYEAFVVTSAQLVERIADGFDVVADLGDGRYAVRRPIG